MGVCVTLANITWRKRSAVLIALTSQRAIKLDTKIFMCQIEWVNNADGVLCKLWDFIYLKHNISTFFLEQLHRSCHVHRTIKRLSLREYWLKKITLMNSDSTMWRTYSAEIIRESDVQNHTVMLEIYHQQMFLCCDTSRARFPSFPSCDWSSIME